MKPLPASITGNSYDLPAGDPLRQSLVRHIVLPGHELAALKPRRHETIERFLARARWEFTLPTICALNGEPVLRAQWSRQKIKASDSVVFLSKTGKTTGQMVGLIALIALTILAPYAAGFILGAELAATVAIGTITFGQMLAAGIPIGGVVSIDALPKGGSFPP